MPCLPRAYRAGNKLGAAPFATGDGRWAMRDVHVHSWMTDPSRHVNIPGDWVQADRSHVHSMRYSACEDAVPPPTKVPDLGLVSQARWIDVSRAHLRRPSKHENDGPEEKSFLVRSSRDQVREEAARKGGKEGPGSLEPEP